MNTTNRTDRYTTIATCTLDIKDVKQAAVAKDIDAFLNNGGEITYIPKGVSGCKKNTPSGLSAQAYFAQAEYAKREEASY